MMPLVITAALAGYFGAIQRPFYLIGWVKWLMPLIIGIRFGVVAGICSWLIRETVTIIVFQIAFSSNPNRDQILSDARSARMNKSR